MTAPRLLRPDEVAARLGISRSKVYALMACGELPVTELGLRGKRVREDGLAAWIDEHTTGRLRAEEDEEGEPRFLLG